MNQTATQDKQDETQLDLTLLVAPNPKLNIKSKPVLVVGDYEKALIKKMFTIMADHAGIGLAAPQVGVHNRIIVLDVPELEAFNDVNATTHGKFALINPQISRASLEFSKWKEGCLSVPLYEEEVSRPNYVEVDALDENGEPITIFAAGLLACCIQHEIDHLDGKLFIDRLSRLKKGIALRKIKKFRKRVGLPKEVSGIPVK